MRELEEQNPANAGAVFPAEHHTAQFARRDKHNTAVSTRSATMTDVRHTVDPSTSPLSAAYRAIRVLCEQPSGATLYVCESRATGEEIVVKQHNKHNQCSAQDDRDDEAIVIVHGHNEPPIALTRSLDSFDQERCVAQKLQDHPHPNVVRCLPLPHSISSCDTLVMEYCPRGDLFSLLECHPHRCFDEREATHLFRAIANGVAHLHSLDIAHRDLSLENVLLDADGLAKVCDFGLSTRATVRARECVGKLQYMAPEVASGTESYDPVLADVWSLGVMLFMLLTGSPLFAFAAPTDAAWGAMERVGVSGILRSWRMRDRVSDETVTLLSDMLRTDPAQRLASLDAVLARLH